jgi:hypothetical protein
LAEYEGLTHKNSKDGAELANFMLGEGKKNLVIATSALKRIALNPGRTA